MINIIYTIDFEATQFTNEMISIGLTSLNGQTFYSLIKPKHKIGSFVKKLTGITQPDLVDAPTIDVVIRQLYDAFKFTSEDVIYSYSNNDKQIILGTINNTTNPETIELLQHLLSIMTDFSHSVSKFFDVKQVSLKEAVACVRNEEIEQRHNALEDAQMLAEVVEAVPFVENPHPMYVIEARHWNGQLKYFARPGVAADFLIKYLKINVPREQVHKTINNKLRQPTNAKYYGYTWNKIEI